MIITEAKPLEEVAEMLKGFKRVFVVGCGTCATTCQTGGEEQVKQMVEKLKEMGKEVVGWVVVETPCDVRVARRDLRKTNYKEADVLLCLCCGAGVQTLCELTGKICVPGLNTKFIGETERIGRFYERCRACGDCILFYTGGICPVTRCAKGLMNGPCGGQADGKCEVGGWKKDCAWVLIYKRLKELGMLDVFMRERPPLKHSLKAGPQEVVWR